MNSYKSCQVRIIDDYNMSTNWWTMDRDGLKIARKWANPRFLIRTWSKDGTGRNLAQSVISGSAPPGVLPTSSRHPPGRWPGDTRDTSDARNAHRSFPAVK